MRDHRLDMTEVEIEDQRRAVLEVRFDQAGAFTPSAKHKAKAAKRHEANKRARKARKVQR